MSKKTASASKWQVRGWTVGNSSGDRYLHPLGEPPCRLVVWKQDTDALSSIAIVQQ